MKIEKKFLNGAKSFGVSFAGGLVIFSRRFEWAVKKSIIDSKDIRTISIAAVNFFEGDTDAVKFFSRYAKN